MKKILIVVAAKAFRDLEFITPKAFFEQDGCQVETISTENTSIGRFGFKIEHHLSISAISSEDFDGIFFVGGIGSLDLIDNIELKALTQSFKDQNKVIGAICAAPRILLEWGILDGKKCTGHNWDKKFPTLCTKNKAIYENNSVVFDENFITGDGPESIEETSIAFLRAL